MNSASWLMFRRILVGYRTLTPLFLEGYAMEEDIRCRAAPRPGTSVTNYPLLVVLREGAGRMLMQAVEAEVEAFLAAHAAFEIIDKRIRMTPLKISGDARWTVITLSRGSPYYVQMLSKYAAQNAAYNRTLTITTTQVEQAMDKFIEESGQSFQEDYRVATSSNQADNLFKEVLLACALSQTDDGGFLCQQP